MAPAPERPNILLLITDQQRAAMHWPDEPGWLDALMPADAELRRTGITFTEACTATAMCTPSRATFLTGTYPSRHGATLTLTIGDLQPDPRNLPAIVRDVTRIARRGEAPRARLARTFLRGALRLPPHGGGEPVVPAGYPTLGSMLAAAGYTVVYKGKWHLSHPLAGGHSWGWDDAKRIARDYGFGGWEPPDSGENAKAEHFGGGTAGPLAEGFDEFYTRQAEAFLAQQDLPEPFCLVVSLVNPHDVLGYPSSYEQGGYRREDFAGLGVQLPPTIDERLTGKPAVHALMRLGQTSYVGGLRDRRAQLDYVNFYAYLHRLVDEKIGRVVGSLGDPGDPSSLRSRTVVARISDHGELGLSHGGLRQKMFNAYEETLRVPFTISNPLLFPEPRETGAPATLADLVPTLLDLAGARHTSTLDGFSRAALVASHAEPDREQRAMLPATLARLLDDPPADAAPGHTLFTYDDHQAGTASQDAPGQPNRVRAVRDRRHTYAVYLDPAGRAAPEYELYDRDADPNQVDNLVGVRTGTGRTAAVEAVRCELAEQLAGACERVGALAP
ncbi:MAG: sulfatase-like hydrolase/transferase [Baekduia sp.]